MLIFEVIETGCNMEIQNETPNCSLSPRCIVMRHQPFGYRSAVLVFVTMQLY